MRSKQPLTYLTGAMVEAIAPCHCLLCGLPSRRPLALCAACATELPTSDYACRRCALPMATDFPLCGSCQRRAPAFSAAIAPCLYQRPLSGFVQAFKYRGDLGQARLLAELMSETVLERLLDEPPPDALVPMPLHWWRRWRRGFNQADLLARALCAHPQLRPWALRVDTTLCRRRRATPAQTGLDRKQRARNLRGAFRARRSLEGMQLAIVDDVMTTGASADALAQTLLGAGACRVEVWCCARTAEPGGAMSP